MTDLARWNLKVSASTDRDLRMHLAANGGKKGDLSRYVEESVSRRLLFDVIDEVQARNGDIDPSMAQRLVEEAMEETRQTFWTKRRH
jgi:Ribbon-helix-helix domain